MNKSVLIVDDKPSSRNLLVTALTDLGYNQIMVSDGQEALDALASQSIMAMIVDMNMPGMNGLELGRRIRAT